MTTTASSSSSSRLTPTEGVAGLFVAVVAFAALRAAADGQLGTWVAAKFLNAGEEAPAPPPGGLSPPGGSSAAGTGTDAAQGGTKQFGDPVPSANLVSVWGDPRDGGARTHRGVDLAAPRGTPVLAIAGGTVEYARGGFSLCGTGVKINHGGGYESLYCHLDEIANLDAGGTVRRGQKIGTVGNTGNAKSTGPHLHFEIHRNGTAINPKSLIGR